MYDVREVYQRPHDPGRPVSASDATKRLIKEARVRDDRQRNQVIKVVCSARDARGTGQFKVRVKGN